MASLSTAAVRRPRRLDRPDCRDPGSRVGRWPTAGRVCESTRLTRSPWSAGSSLWRPLRRALERRSVRHQRLRGARRRRRRRRRAHGGAVRARGGLPRPLRPSCLHAGRETLDAPTGSAVFVRDPAVRRQRPCCRGWRRSTRDRRAAGWRVTRPLPGRCSSLPHGHRTAGNYDAMADEIALAPRTLSRQRVHALQPRLCRGNRRALGCRRRARASHARGHAPARPRDVGRETTRISAGPARAVGLPRRRRCFGHRRARWLARHPRRCGSDAVRRPVDLLRGSRRSRDASDVGATSSPTPAR